MEVHRHHPVQKAIRQYLRDHAALKQAEAATRWINGSLMSREEEGEQSLYARIMLELESLSFEAIDRFYSDNQQFIEELRPNEHESASRDDGTRAV